MPGPTHDGDLTLPPCWIPMNLIRPSLLATLSLVLFACAAPPPLPPPEPKPPVISTAGTWRGSSTRFQADNRNCPHPGLVMLQIWDDRFQYRWDFKTYVDATIDPDGAIHGGAPDITLVGKYNGRKIEGDVTNGNCGLHFTVYKRDN